ncbi:hypothetical protein MRX96_009932 [Rhipicephalus microplus]
MLIRQNLYHKRTFEFISKAFKYNEENGTLADPLHFKELAIDLYRRGIKELQKGIAIDYSQGKGRSREGTHRLTDNIRVKVEVAKNRLESMIKIKHLRGDLLLHAGVAHRQANQKRRAW